MYVYIYSTCMYIYMYIYVYVWTSYICVVYRSCSADRHVGVCVCDVCVREADDAVDKVADTQVDGYCHIYQQAISHTSICDVSHMWMYRMSHEWMSKVTHVNTSCHTYEWVMAHLWMSHGTPLNESWHTSEWVMAHTRRGSYVWHDSFKHVTLLISLCDCNCVRSIGVAMSHGVCAMCAMTRVCTHDAQTQLQSRIEMSDTRCCKHSYESQSHIEMSNTHRNNAQTKYGVATIRRLL